ncbi:MAG: hypothetical protein AAGF95_07820 [Chloroflexota bacterium]
MPLQNRVTPYSSIEVAPARGLLMGNRGCLHNDQRELVSQRWRHRAWISCVLQHGDRRRTLMQPRHYTELFFLDEAVALAAGHRPCALCRRAAFEAFRTAVSTQSRVRATQLDAMLHSERVARMRGQVSWRDTLGNLPDGSMIVLPDVPDQVWLKHKGCLLRWSHVGYDCAIPLSDAQIVEVLTPPTIRCALAAGYEPILHSSVGGSSALGS